MKKLLYLLLAVLMVSGCATYALSPNQLIYPQKRLVNLPSLQEIHSVELGDTIVSKGTIYEHQGIILQGNILPSDIVGPIKIALQAGQLVAEKEDEKYMYYVRERVNGVYPIGLRISKSDDSDIKGFLENPGTRNMFVLTIRKKPEIKPNEIISFEEKSFKQELIYNGRAGKNVKFLYREFSGNLMRPSFSQEIQYDLNEGNVVGFKGARIEIIEASNTNLKYKLNKSFPDNENE